MTASETADMVPPNSNLLGLNRFSGEKLALSGCCTTNMMPNTTNSARMTSCATKATLFTTMAVFMPMSDTMATMARNPKHRTKMGMSGSMLWMAMAAIRYTMAGLTRYCSSMSQPAMKPGILPNTWLT